MRYFSSIYIKIFKVKVAGFCDYCKTEKSLGFLTGYKSETIALELKS